MNLFQKFTSGLMTKLAGIEDNNGTTPSTLPQPNLEPKAYTNPDGSKLDLEDFYKYCENLDLVILGLMCIHPANKDPKILNKSVFGSVTNLNNIFFSLAPS